MFNRWMEWLRRLIGAPGFEYGSLVVAPCRSEPCQECRQEVFVETHYSPERVWLAARSCGSAPVCCGDVDFISVPQVVPGGFIFTVIINSGCCRIDWFAARR